MEFNFLVVALAALIPLVTGFVWYHPKIFGNTWMKTAGLTEEGMKKGNMAVIFLVTIVFSFLLAFALSSIVIHQYSIYGVLAGQPGFNEEGSEVQLWIKDFMAKHGRNFRTFKHGALHGTIAGVFIAMPILGINALFERKSAKYIFIHTGYWMLTLALMGGVICQFA